ncbi:hypothetical protein EDD27_8609 [Nonomuraea polychroma]|uniref:Uncharacterized protein n=1 Tax=Nonomuraea polychroma TaxID=46176 RepID=A0A438MIQ3_9ACTN|nr:hypothetical protein EDD27_8609 [Nonomuraea polychroma]
MDVLGRVFLPRLERRLGRDTVDVIVRDAPAALFSGAISL